MKKTYLTHFVAFCFGAIVAYTLIDMADNRDRDRQLEKRRLRAIQRKDRDPNRNKDLLAKSIDGIFHNAVQGMQKSLTGGVEIEEFETDKYYRIVLIGDGLTEESLSFNINKGMLLLKLNVVKQEKTSFGVSEKVLKFARSFYIPKNVTNPVPKVKSTENKIEIEFSKE